MARYAPDVRALVSMVPDIDLDLWPGMAPRHGNSGAVVPQATLDSTSLTACTSISWAWRPSAITRPA